MAADGKPPSKRAPRKAAPKPTAADRKKARLASVTPINRDPDSRSHAAKIGKSPTSVKGLAIQERRAKALQLRRMGQTYQQLADTLREMHPELPETYGKQRAMEDVQAMLDTVTVEAVNDYLQEDLATLLAMQRRYFTAAMNGDVKAGSIMLRILERRARYLGLDSPIKHQLTGADGGAIHLSVEDPAAIHAAAMDALVGLLPHAELPQLSGTDGPDV